jgi:hypothetical protein
MGDVDGAIHALETLIAAGQRPPKDYAPDHLNLAVTYAHRGEIDRAIQHLRASAVDPDYLRTALPKLAAPLLSTDDVTSPAFFRALAEVARTAGLAELAEAATRRAG